VNHERTKIFGPSKPLSLRVGDLQPVRQTPVVPQRRCPRLVVDLPLHRFLTSCSRYNDTNSIVSYITKTLKRALTLSGAYSHVP
jgi:hypothetical protein